MGDLGPLFQGLAELLKPLLGEGLKSFFRTVAVGVAASPLLAALCAWIAAGGSFWRGLVAALVALGCSGVAMVFLAGHRAAWRMLAVGLGKLELGRRALGVVFERLLQLGGDGEHGERGVGVARAAERVPLAEAERRLSQAVTGLVRATGDGRGVRAWLRRSLQRKLLELVQRVTLARFREEGAKAGGVDLLKVRDELSARIDRLLSEQVRSALNRMTALALLGVTVASVAVAFALRRFA